MDLPKGSTLSFEERIKALIYEGNLFLDGLSVNQAKQLEHISHDIDLVGQDFAIDSFENTQYCKVVKEAFESYLASEEINRGIALLISILNENDREQRLLPLLDAFNLCNGIKLPTISSLCRPHTTAAQIPSSLLLLSYKERKKLVEEIEKLVNWLKVDPMLVLNEAEKDLECQLGDRNTQILKSYFMGLTLDKIGKENALSGERVRQIIQKGIRSFPVLIRKHGYDFLVAIYFLVGKDGVIDLSDLAILFGDKAFFYHQCIQYYLNNSILPSCFFLFPALNSVIFCHSESIKKPKELRQIIINGIMGKFNKPLITTQEKESIIYTVIEEFNCPISVINYLFDLKYFWFGLFDVYMQKSFFSNEKVRYNFVLACFFPQGIDLANRKALNRFVREYNNTFPNFKTAIWAVKGLIKINCLPKSKSLYSESEVFVANLSALKRIQT